MLCIDAQAENNPVLPCPSITTPPNAGLCAKTDSVSKIQDLVCCNACSPRHKEANSTPKTYIAIGVPVGIIAIGMIIFLFLLYKKYKYRDSQDIRDKEPQYTGPDEPQAGLN